MTIKFVSKLEVVHKEIGGCTQGSWRLSDQMRIVVSIALIYSHSVTHSVTHWGRYRGAAKKYTAAGTGGSSLLVGAFVFNVTPKKYV